MATASTSTTLQETPASLRKRSRILQKAHSGQKTAGSPDSNGIAIPDTKAKQADKTGSPESRTVYESPEEVSDYDEEQSDAEEMYEQEQSSKSHRRPTLNTAGLERRSSQDPELMSPTSRAWYEFDLAVVVALVSPIGNWLTGGDHVKNLLLIVLLIYYLHQIIEVPWKLYQKSRPHSRASHIPPSGALDDPDSAESRLAQIAASELRRLELFFLALCFFSPFAGAALLRYTTSAVLGPDAVSWFSTGLFVLATGMRPWSHLIDRLSRRTEELQDFVHYPSSTRGVHEDEFRSLEERVRHLEKSLGKVRQKMEAATEEVYDYVDDAVDSVEHAIRKQEKKWHKYEEMVDQMGQAVGNLSDKSFHHRDSGFAAAISADLKAIRAYLQYILQLLVPNWLLASPEHAYYHSKHSGKLLGHQPNGKLAAHSLSPSSSSMPLETIIEEEEHKRETVVEPDTPLGKPYSITSKLIYGIGYIATAPLRAVLRMILRNY